MDGRRIAIPLVVVAAVAAGVVGGALIGVPGLSGASTPNSQTAAATASGAPRPGGPRAEIEAAAKALNLTTDELLQKLSDGKTTIADIAGQQSIKIDTVIDAIAAADRQRIEDFVNNPLHARGHGFGKGGPGGPGGPAGFGGARLGLAGPLAAAAKALGIEPKDLVKELRDGKTIAQVAQDKHVQLSTVIDAMVAAANARIDKAKDAGKIDDAKAADLKSKVKDAVTKAVNGELGGGAHLGWGFGGRGRHGMPGGGPPPGP